MTKKAQSSDLRRLLLVIALTFVILFIFAPAILKGYDTFKTMFNLEDEEEEFTGPIKQACQGYVTEMKALFEKGDYDNLEKAIDIYRSKHRIECPAYPLAEEDKPLFKEKFTEFIKIFLEQKKIPGFFIHYYYDVVVEDFGAIALEDLQLLTLVEYYLSDLGTEGNYDKAEKIISELEKKSPELRARSIYLIAKYHKDISFELKTESKKQVAIDDTIHYYGLLEEKEVQYQHFLDEHDNSIMGKAYYDLATFYLDKDQKKSCEYAKKARNYFISNMVLQDRYIKTDISYEKEKGEIYQSYFINKFPTCTFT